MAQFCRRCGSELAENATVCNNCNTPTSDVAEVTQVLSKYFTPASMAALCLSVFFFVITVITAFIDSSVFASRVYTTAIMWHLPLMLIILIIYSIVSARKNGSSTVIGWMAAFFMTLAFFFSNPIRNTVLDVMGNKDNIGEIMNKSVGNNINNTINSYNDMPSSSRRY